MVATEVIPAPQGLCKIMFKSRSCSCCSDAEMKEEMAQQARSAKQVDGTPRRSGVDIDSIRVGWVRV